MGYLNPLLRLPAARGLLALGAQERAALGRLLMDLRAQANDEAENAWRRRKGPMACYWRAVSTYARHLAHVLRADRSAPTRRAADTRRSGALRGCSMPLGIGGQGVMRADDIVAIFEDLSIRGQVTSLDEALSGLANWLARRRCALSDDDFSALIVAGAAMYRAGKYGRTASPTFLPA